MAITDIDVTSWGAETPQTENIEKIKTNFEIIKDSGGVVSGSGIIVSETAPDPEANPVYIDPNADDPSAGTTDHSLLTSESRALADQHPIEAITGLATQLATTIPALITKGDGAVVWVTTTGAFSLTVPAWANVAYISGCAAGGGGNASHGLGGGGGQSINRARYAVTAGAVLSGSIGAKGTGATTHNASPASVPGTNGGNTVLTGFFTLTGGYGGGNHPTSQWYGGAGGGPGSTAGKIRGLMAYTGSTPASIWNGGDGGDSLFGKGAKGGYYPNNYGGIPSVNGGNGIGFGSGGGGGGTDSNNNVTSGGNGADGFLVFEFAYEA